MNYPLNMKLPDPQIGFAVANDEAEHAALTAMGYIPPLVQAVADPAETDGQGHTVESVRAQLDAAGIAYDNRFGLARLMTLLPATQPAV